MKIFKKVLIFFLYFVFIAYSLEILTILFLKKEYNLIDKNIDQLKQEKKKEVKNYDNRGSYEAFSEEKIKENLSPSFRYSEYQIYHGDYKKKIRNFLEKKISQKKIIPLRGPINKKSLGSAEEGKYEIIKNDKYGFKNLNEVYGKEIDLMILGDSFAEGSPFGNYKDTNGIIRKISDFNSINYGIGGTGPLTSLAVVREYGKHFKPKNVFYFFYEGNDLNDMMQEKKTFLLKYIDKNYSQNLVNSNKEIEIFLDEYEKIFNFILPFKIKEEKINEEKIKKSLNLKKTNKYNEKIIDFLELNSLKEIFLTSSVFYKSNIDFILFENILSEMKQEVREWDGNLYFVYLPSWTRYNNKYSLAPNILNKKISKIVKKNNIKFIDIDLTFKKSNSNNINIYNLDVYNHYTQKGYNLIAKQIIKILNE